MILELEQQKQSPRYQDTGNWTMLHKSMQTRHCHDFLDKEDVIICQYEIQYFMTETSCANHYLYPLVNSHLAMENHHA